MNASKSKGGSSVGGNELRMLMWHVSDVLQFYADPRNYSISNSFDDPRSFVSRDNGDKARLALQMLKGEDV